MIGDDNRNAVKSGYLVDLEIEIDQGSGAQYYTLSPFVTRALSIDKAEGKRGIDSRFGVQYYSHRVEIDYLQCDQETKQSLYSASVRGQLFNGVDTRLSFPDGTTVEITLAWTLETASEGPGGLWRIPMQGGGATIEPVQE